MALKPTIYKFNISVSDLNQDYFDTLNLTIALHPSETVERMMARVIAFCIHAHQDKDKLLSFTKGLSAVDEPDIWLKTLDDQLDIWIDVGEPNFERVKKACRLAKRAYLYCFNSKADVWWQQSQPEFSKLAVNVCQFNWIEIQNLSQLVSRTLDLSVTISGESAYIAGPKQQAEVNWSVLQ